MGQGSPNQKAHDSTDFRPTDFASSIGFFNRFNDALQIDEEAELHAPA